MKDNRAMKEVTTQKGHNGHPSGNSKTNNEDLKVSTSLDDYSSHEMKSRVQELEKELSRKESEIEFFKEKLNNNQEILLDVVEDKKLLKIQIQDFELKEIDEKLNNFRDLQRKQHKIEHRLFITKKNLEEARKELEFRKKIIKDMENRGIIDYIMGNYPDSLIEYNKRD
jgi:hypothetical protein